MTQQQQDTQGWGDEFSEPTPPALYVRAIHEGVVRHPNGHLKVERTPTWIPTPEEEAKALASLSKAWPILSTHASYMDGEFDLALSDVRRMLKALREAYVPAPATVAE